MYYTPPYILGCWLPSTSWVRYHTHHNSIQNIHPFSDQMSSTFKSRIWKMFRNDDHVYHNFLLHCFINQFNFAHSFTYSLRMLSAPESRRNPTSRAVCEVFTDEGIARTIASVTGSTSYATCGCHQKRQMKTISHINGHENKRIS